MKFISLLCSLLVFLCVQTYMIENQLNANESLGLIYERSLKNFGIKETQDEKKLFFVLDNDWIFESDFNLFDESKIYSLSKLLNSRVLITAQPQLSGLEMTFENPTKKGCDKTTFPISITQDTYDSLLVVTDIEIISSYWWYNAYITLSDGSRWSVKTSLGVDFARTYWSIGDHVIVSKHYNKNTLYSLVNLDVSGTHYVDYYKDHKEQWFSMRDPRHLSVVLCP